MTAPSAWVRRFAPLLRKGERGLDLACGKGRHTRFLLQLGCKVTALDRDIGAVAGLEGAECIEADLEDGAPWPLGERHFDAVIVTNYLFRPLMPRIVAAVGGGGVLLFETFARGNEAYGRPANPDFLLKPGELLDAVRGDLQVVAYEHGFTRTPKPAIVQRICAIRSQEPVHL